MLKTDTPITVNCRHAGGVTQIPLRWPTDEEWAERAHGQRFVTKRLGRGQQETNLVPGESDLKLYQKIAVGENGTAPTLTAGEATRVVQALALCNVTDIELEGNNAVVAMETIHGEVKHSLRLPTADEVLDFQRSHRMRELPFNKYETRLNFEGAVKLWESCGGKGIDYSGAVPAVHKYTAISEVIQYLEREVTARADESDF